MLKNFSILFLVLHLSAQLLAQVNVRDSLVAGTLITFQLGVNAAAGDLADRFGGNLSVGLDVEYKFKSNYLIGIGSTFYFGDDVKNKDQIFGGLATSQQAFIGLNGEYAILDFLHRGVFVGPHIARIFPVIGPNQNSGIIVKLGAGYVQNQIHIRNPNETFPQLLGDYGEGYDRMHSGFGLRQYLGYINSGNSRTINYSFGFEFIEGFTKSARGYNYDTRLPDTSLKLDLYIGFKAAWFLPIYRDQRQQFYYY
jgi:hypothetical protein